MMLSYLMLYAFFIMLCFLFPEAVSGHECPSGWHSFQDWKCFYFDAKPATFRQNSNLCQSMNATMVSIHSQEEDLFIKETKGKKRGNYWMAGEQVTYGIPSYQWLDGTNVDYFNWYQNEPNCGKRESCCATTWTSLGWFDFHCDYHLRQMCQKVVDHKSKGNPSFNLVTRLNDVLRDLDLRLSTVYGLLSAEVKQNQAIIVRLYKKLNRDQNETLVKLFNKINNVLENVTHLMESKERQFMTLVSEVKASLGVDLKATFDLLNNKLIAINDTFRAEVVKLNETYFNELEMIYEKLRVLNIESKGENEINEEQVQDLQLTLNRIMETINENTENVNERVDKFSDNMRVISTESKQLNVNQEQQEMVFESKIKLIQDQVQKLTLTTGGFIVASLLSCLLMAVIRRRKRPKARVSFKQKSNKSELPLL